MAPVITVPSPTHSYAASMLSDTYDDSDAMSDYHPVAVAVQPRRNFQHQVQLLESKARLTSIRSSVLSGVPSTLSAEPGPTVPNSPADQLTFPELHSKPSSVLLRDENVERSQPGASSQSKTLRGQESSSTLHSFYEPQKLPLIVSQQTSDSSSRDFALRKDCPPVLTPESQRKHFFDNSKSRAKSNEKKQRKQRADLSTLFPKPGTGNKAESKKTENPPYYKMHIKKPKAGTKHWFDSYDDEISDDDFNFEPEMQPGFADGIGDAFMNLSSGDSIVSEQPQQMQETHITKKPETSKSDRVLGIEASLPPLGTHLPSSQPHEQPAKMPTPKSKSKTKSPFVNPLETANLKEQSILFLSSDDEDESPSQSRPATRMTGGIRESLAMGALDVTEIEIGEAITVRSQPAIVMHSAPKMDIPKPYSDPGRSTRMRVVVPDRRSSRMASFFTEASPQFQEVAIARSDTASRNSRGGTDVHSGAELVNDAGESVESLPIERSEAALTEVPWEENNNASQILERRVSTRLMPVTRQEQALLAAMRSKKATMRRRSVHQEDSERWENESERDSFYQHRPRTSTDTNAPAFVELGSNNYADWASRRRFSMMGHPYEGTRASVTTFATTSQRASTRLSHYPSDESPNTPPSARNSSGLQQRTSTGLGTHFSLSSSGYRSHSRSRTDSSHIVVLDDLNDSPKALDMENGVSSPRFSAAWAYNRWSDGTGANIATVH